MFYKSGNREAVRDTFNSDFSKTGYFNSPGYPYKSDTEKSKEFHFKGIPGERVRIVFDNFNLYRKNVNNRCGESDSVLRYEKENQKVVNLCGNIVPLPIMSESNELKLEYRQANEFPEEKQGFNGSYAFVTRCKPATNDTIETQSLTPKTPIDIASRSSSII
ncbi:hypothetical protein PGB90_001911 [Kerria lacca]